MENKLKKKILFFLLGACLLFTLLVGEKKARAEGGCGLLGWAWSENIGWISFSSENPQVSPTVSYGVTLDSDSGTLSGYGWSEHLGWLSFNDSAGCPVSPCTPELVGDLSTCEVEGDCQFEGWAKFLAGGDVNAGGWGGWLRLSDANYGLWPGKVDSSRWQVQDFAWGSADNAAKGVVGWMSANCANQGVCGTSNYYIDLPCVVDENPSVLPKDPIHGDCCYAPKPPVVLHWEFNDKEDTDQTARRVRVYASASGTLVDDSCEADNPSDCAEDSVSYPPSGITWDTTYDWEVKVWDSAGNSSGFVPGPTSFTTDPGSISPHFSPPPPDDPLIGEDVQFSDESTTAGNITISSWSWQFEGATPSSSTLQNPIVKFDTALPEGNEVLLEVSGSLSCTTRETLYPRLQLPEWEEVAPNQ